MPYANQERQRAYQNEWAKAQLRADTPWAKRQRAYKRWYHRTFERKIHQYVGVALCLRCAEFGSLFRISALNTKTGRVSPGGWDVQHGRRSPRRTHHVSGVRQYPLSALRNPLKAILTDGV